MRILCFAENITALRTAFDHVKNQYPFSIEAMVVLPDHIHCILTLPEGDSDYPLRMRLIKSFFSKRCKNSKSHGTTSRDQKREKAIWQRRYWEHAIIGDEDFEQHVEYIHYNPVKHGLVNAPKDWEYSSFHSYVRKGIYNRDWGAGSGIVFEEGIGVE
jgi:putative transposase